MRGLNPKYLEKLDDEQRVFALTMPGKMFLDDFVHLRGNHMFVVGTTGSGKTNKGYWLVNWLKHTETQIWLDSGKSNEILPLFCQGKPVRIICPEYCDVIIEEHVGGRWQTIQNPPTVVHVNSASSTWHAIAGPKRDHNSEYHPETINILAFRNAFWSTAARAEWMSELFETLANWTRQGTMPKIYPCSIHVDESQWVIAGARISKDSDRVKSAEVITENALEIRSYGGRLVLYAQAFKNIPPAIRENLLCAILCRGAEINSDESAKLSRACHAPSAKRPENFRRNEGKFVNEFGVSAPVLKPWGFSLLPKSKRDRDWCARCRVRYVGYHDRPPASSEGAEECMPELGRYAAAAIPPEKFAEFQFTRWDIPAEM